MNEDDLMIFQEASSGNWLVIERADEISEFNTYLFDKNKELISNKKISTLFEKNVPSVYEDFVLASNSAMKMYGINKKNVYVGEAKDIYSELENAKSGLRNEHNNQDKQLFSDLTDVLSDGEVITRSNPSLDGEIRVKRGGMNEGLVHLIDHRIRERVLNKNISMDVEQAQKETSAVLFLAIDNLDKAPAVKEANGNWSVNHRGIKSVITKDKKGHYVLTGYDNNQSKQEATESINAVIAQYGDTPEFLGMYAQVGAVIASQNILPQTPEKSSNEKEFAAKSKFNNLAKEYNGLLKDYDENIKDYNNLLSAYNKSQEENQKLKNQLHSQNQKKNQSISR